MRYSTLLITKWWVQPPKRLARSLLDLQFLPCVPTRVFHICTLQCHYYLQAISIEALTTVNIHTLEVQVLVSWAYFCWGTALSITTYSQSARMYSQHEISRCERILAGRLYTVMDRVVPQHSPPIMFTPYRSKLDRWPSSKTRDSVTFRMRSTS